MKEHNEYIREKVRQVRRSARDSVNCVVIDYGIRHNPQRFVCGAFNCILYQIGRRYPRLVLIPCNGEYDLASGANASTEDLEFSQWFCQRTVITPLGYFPGTDCSLQNSYDIVAVPQPSRDCPETDSTCSRTNTTLDWLFSVPWRGNLIVVKRGRRDPSRVVHITQPELALIDTLVER